MSKWINGLPPPIMCDIFTVRENLTIQEISRLQISQTK